MQISKQIKKVKKTKKPTKYQLRIKQLKFLTNWLFNPNPKTIEQITKNNKEFKNTIYRIFSYALSKPLLIHYIDKYLNNFNILKFDNNDILYTFVIIFKRFNMSKNSIYYAKFKTNKQQQFNDIISAYLNQYNETFNYNDLLGLYKLYNLNIITELNLQEIELLNQNKPITSKTVKTNILFDTNFIQQKQIKLSNKMEELNNKIIKHITNRKICKSCSLYKEKKLIFETNLQDINEVDVIFIGIAPTKKDIENEYLFSDKAGNILRNYINILLKNLNNNLIYILTNACFCFSPFNIKDYSQIFNNCESILQNIINTFNPSYIVLLDLKVCKKFNIKGSMKQLNATMIQNIIPSINPIKLINNNKPSIKSFEEVFKVLFKNIQQKQINKMKEKEKDVEFRIPKELILTKISKDLTLFDITHSGNKLIYIMLDKDGKKRYIIKKIKIPIYIKYGNYQDCNYITDKVDLVAYVNTYEKAKISSTLYQKLQRHI
jgi:uracil-DNA glycosylase family 4